jgi:hypothetical protein
LKGNPRIARDWIDFFVYDKGVEPDDIDEEDITEFWGSHISRGGVITHI